MSHNIIARLAGVDSVCYTYNVISKTKKQKLIRESQVHDKDTGSPEVQISILTKRIEELSKHLKANAKDNHSRRGLLAMVADRQAHMKYLEKKNPKRALALQKKLGLKK
jgi:small subunit ribosomal protein S15